MSTLRDQGYEALQRADIPNAIQLLESAIQSDPNDYYALLYLGAAYGQANRQQDAVRVLTQSVQVQPSNAQARFNLGVALERAGWPQEAMTALQQALTLQPDYPKAQEALQRLQGGAAPTVPPPPVAPTATPAPAGTPAEHATVFLSPNLLDNLQPSQANAGTAEPTQATPAPPAGYGQQPPVSYGQPPANYGQPQQPMYGQPAPNDAPQGLAGGYGAAQTPPAYGQPPPTMYGQPQPPGYGAAPPPAAGAYGSYPQPTYYEDKFDLAQAFRDWLQVLRAPKAFFADQAYRTGYKAPLAMMFLMLLFNSGIQLVFSLVHPATIGATLIGIVGILTIGFAFGALFTWIGAGILHLVGKIFGNSGEVSGSFRAIAYSSAPDPFFSIIMGILALVLVPASMQNSFDLTTQKPGNAQIRVIPAQFEEKSSGSGSFNTDRSAGQNNPFDGSATRSTPNPFKNPLLGPMMAFGGIGILVGLIRFLWGVTLLVIGISNVQRTSIGAAIGTVLIPLAVIFLLAIGAAMVIGMAVFSAAASR